MECPSCKKNFFPQANSCYLGEVGNGTQGFIFWQKCPSCKELVILMKKSEQYFSLLEDPDPNATIIYPK
jgi:hypothetical protein